jgi:uncharacterized membrane protein
MAANKILEEFRVFTNFAQGGFKYNLQVLPDTLTASAFLFALLFQSPSLGALSGTLLLLNFIHPVFANFLSNFVSGTLGAADFARCSGHFPGVSMERIVGLGAARGFGSLDSVWPSYYSMFLGTIAGYIGLLPFLYQKELDASPKRKAASVLGLVVLGIVLILGAAYRIISGCDNAFGVMVGILAGAVIGMAIAGFLAWISERNLTNILGMPLLRSKTADGKPIYVCERK